MRIGLLCVRQALRRYQRARARHLWQWGFRQWRGIGSVRRLRMAVSVLIAFVLTAADAGTQEPPGHDFQAVPRIAGEPATAAAAMDADD
jgi:hypothetical protein